jgi:protein phosphatase
MLIEASTAEAEAVSAVWRAAKEASAASSEDSLSEGIGSESPLSETSPMAEDFNDEGSQEPDVKLHSRAVCNLMKILSVSIFKLNIGRTMEASTQN